MCSEVIPIVGVNRSCSWTLVFENSFKTVIYHLRRKFAIKKHISQILKSDTNLWIELRDIDTVQHAVICCCGCWNVSEHSGWPYPCDIFWFANSETTLTKIIGKFWEKDNIFPNFLKMRIIRQFWQKYSHFEKIWDNFLYFSHDFLMIFVSVFDGTSQLYYEFWD